MYADQAKKIKQPDQLSHGSNDQIFAYWALNDVATSPFIQGEAYRKADKKDEAIAAYKRAANEFFMARLGTRRDGSGNRRKPLKKKISMLESGSNLDFGGLFLFILDDTGMEGIGSE